MRHVKFEEHEVIERVNNDYAQLHAGLDTVEADFHKLVQPEQLAAAILTEFGTIVAPYIIAEIAADDLIGAAA